MKTVKILLLLFVCSGLVGCMSQYAHERAIEELEMEQQQSTQEIEDLQKVVSDKDEDITRLRQEKENLAQDLNEHETEVAQIQEHVTNLGQTLEIKDATMTEMTQEKKDLVKDLERIEGAVVRLKQEKAVLTGDLNEQKQVKDAQLQQLKKELETIYQDVLGLGELSGNNSLSGGSLFSSESIDLGDLASAVRNMRASMETQMNEVAQMRDLNVQLEKDLSALEDRLQGVDRLRKELEAMRTARAEEEARYARLQEELAQVQAAREEQAAKFAKVKSEVQTVGEEIDRITKALEEKFGKSLVVTQHQDRLVLTMLGQVLFNSGEAQLTPLGSKIMKQVGEVLASLPKKNIHVEGHTDNNPIYGQLQDRYATNWELSTARATTVLRYLIEETGMAPKVFAALGYADTRPAASNDTEEGRAQNRRVEIVLYPEQAPVIQKNDQVATLTP